MQTIIHESKQGVSYIYLNRPSQFNALNQEMLEELLKVLHQVAQNADNILVVSGNGHAFCAGGDVKMMAALNEKQSFDTMMDTIKEMVCTLYHMPKIIISAIHGSAAGLGLSMALAGDYVIASEEAKLGMLFVGIGLAPDGGGHFFLEQRLGTSAAKHFIWSGKTIPATQAKNMELIDEVTEGDVIDAAGAMAKKLQSLPITAMLQTKLLYHQQQADLLQTVLKKEKENQWKLRQTVDHQEGVQAFIEKRKPVFIGK